MIERRSARYGILLCLLIGITTTSVHSACAQGASVIPPLTAQDIGSPAIAGSSLFDQSTGTFTIQSAGVDIGGSADQFHYVYQPVTGDFDVSVRLSSLTVADPWTQAGVMIRENVTAGSAHALAGLSSQLGYFFERRPTADDVSTSTDGGAAAVPGWVRLNRTGSLITASRSVDGLTWTVMGSDSFTMADTVYAGIAVTSHNVNTATTAVLDNLSMSQSQPAPPTVTLTSPANGATFTAPASILLTADAASTTGMVARVDFYNGTTLLGSSTTAPYAFNWTNVAAGTYSLTATAADNAGGYTSSATAAISVTAAGASSPTAVAFEASTDHATGVTSYLLEVFADGADPATATPVASSDLGKPDPDASGGITVNQASFFGLLAPGAYQASVCAIGPGGQSQSIPVAFTAALAGH